MSARIAIAGAGIGGLAAAVGLLRAGFDVQIYEQAPEFGDVGAGVTLTTGAMRCLAYLGLEDDVERYVSRPRATPFLHYATGEVLAGAAPPPEEEVTHERYAAGHLFRADLHAILAHHVRRLSPSAVELDRRVVGAEQDDARARACFADASSAEADALIGCDGVRSSVRNALFGDDEPVFSGRIAYRFLVPGEQARPLLGVSELTAQYVGPSKVFIRYPVSNGRLLNCVALSASDRWTAEGWSLPATREELLEELAGWHPDVRALVALAPPERLIKWGIFEREPCETWTIGRIALLGDAAHPMQPFMGLGATTAIEDAAILARALAESPDIAEGLRRYERARIPRAARAFEASRRQGAIFDQTDPAHYPPPGAPAHDPAFQTFDPAEVVLA
jgi:salicylate hydroxylase